VPWRVVAIANEAIIQVTSSSTTRLLPVEDRVSWFGMKNWMGAGAAADDALPGDVMLLHGLPRRVTCVAAGSDLKLSVDARCGPVGAEMRGSWGTATRRTLLPDGE